MRVALGTGGTLGIAGVPPHVERTGVAPPPVVFLPAATRADTVVAETQPTTPGARRALEIFQDALDERAAPGDSASAAPALSLLDALQSCCDAGLRGLVLLIEEPELYLRPQAQRYLYRLLRRFASEGNQVIYSTHSRRS